MERFLRYSLTHDRPIRLIVEEDDGRLRQVSAVVEEWTDAGIRLYILRPPHRVTLPPGRILGASYTPKDEGLEA